MIHILNRRNKVLLERQKKHLFNGPIIVDGGYQLATLYIHEKKMTVSLHDDDLQKDKSFWLKNEFELVRKIEDDMKSKLPAAN